jgi:hypothetical protein
MQEEFLYFVWKNGLYDKKNLITTDGQTIQISHPGYLNTDSGPDFFNSRVQINETIWAGNIEIHIKASDWFIHNHQTDHAYDNVVLHVCWECNGEAMNSVNQKIPCLELGNRVSKLLYENYLDLVQNGFKIPCQALIDKASSLDWINNLERMAVERLNEKCSLIMDEAASVTFDWDEILYRHIGACLGLNVNKLPMQLLVRSVPYKTLQWHKENRMQLEAILFGQAGLLQGVFRDEYPNTLQSEYNFLKGKYKMKPLNTSIWKFMRLRPAAFPTIRISELAGLLQMPRGIFSHVVDVGKMEDLLSWLSAEVSEYWQNHFRFDSETETTNGHIGKATQEIILINAVIPVLFSYGKYRGNNDLCEKAVDWLEKMDAESNRIVKLWESLEIKAENAFQSQALLQLYNKYCNFKRCLQCGIGQKLLMKHCSEK